MSYFDNSGHDPQHWLTLQLAQLNIEMEEMNSEQNAAGLRTWLCPGLQTMGLQRRRVRKTRSDTSDKQDDHPTPEVLTVDDDPDVLVAPRRGAPRLSDRDHDNYMHNRERRNRTVAGTAVPVLLNMSKHRERDWSSKEDFNRCNHPNSEMKSKCWAFILSFAAYLRQPPTQGM